MPDSGLSNPWPRITDYDDAPQRDAREMMSGHPTAPGFRDPKPVRMGRPSPGNGQPGVPAIRPGRRRVPGLFPANSGGGFSVDPEIEVDFPHDF